MKDIKEISQILKDKKKELEEKIETEQIPTLTILLTSYSNILQSNKQILQEFLPEEYSLHEETINNLRKVINGRSKKQNDLNDSIYSENINLQCEEEEDFFNLGKRRANEYLSSAIDSLDNIRRQGRILEGAQNKVAEGLRKMGFSEGMINQITSRYKSDYLLFVCFVVLIIFLYFFIFKIMK
ncbi:vesicular transport protein [Tubulinosema ratisbonensis]|uniref:Vesicular transport protein n=1 Tax=Tubulinosema ratisbonensis TaxID=291195 RepID=A0A437AM00_9MICR|nr:vesicular transport protein [Tubulinosema ratisbonensis]